MGSERQPAPWNDSHRLEAEQVAEALRQCRLHLGAFEAEQRRLPREKEVRSEMQPAPWDHRHRLEAEQVAEALRQCRLHLGAFDAEQRRLPRAVYCGRKVLIPLIAYHWAIRIDDEWYEGAGAEKKQTGSTNQVHRRRGSCAESGTKEAVIIGFTSRTTQEIDDFIVAWIENHRTYRYDLHGDNCHRFVKDFAPFLCGLSVLSNLPVSDHKKAFATLSSVGLSIPHIMGAQSRRGYSCFPEQEVSL